MSGPCRINHTLISEVSEYVNQLVCSYCLQIVEVEEIAQSVNGTTLCLDCLRKAYQPKDYVLTREGVIEL